MITTIRRAWQMIPNRRPWWLLMPLAIFVSLLEMVGAVIVYFLLELVVNPTGPIDLPLIGDLRRFADEGDQDRLLLSIVIGMGIFLAFRAALKVGAKYAQNRVAYNAGAQLTSRLVAGYLRLPYAAHVRRNSSEFIRNSHHAVHELVVGIWLPTIKIVAESLITLGMLTVLFAIAPSATLLAIAVVGVASVVLLLVVQPRLRRIGLVAHRTLEECYKSLQQALHGIRDIKILGREDFFTEEYERSQLKLARARYLRTTATALPSVVIEAALIGLILTLFGIAIATDSDSQAVLSVLGLFGYAGLRLQPSVQHMISSLNEIKHASAPLDDLHADLQEIQSQQQLDNQATPLPFTKSLELEDVSFSYEGTQEAALSDVNLVIHPGEQIGICGPTGGGKTTLVDLITGLLEPTTGRITVDGVDLSSHASAWHRNLGVVPQMVFLIDDTLRRNIALGINDKNIDEHALEEAVELSQLSEFVNALPEGLSTVVGERGVRISGGQRQRIAIARALYRRPAVLVLDEGTSALDTATEASLLEAIESLRGRHTLILIAHRLTSVKQSDKVVFIEHGRIAGIDTYDALEQTNERFRLLTVSS